MPIRRFNLVYRSPIAECDTLQSAQLRELFCKTMRIARLVFSRILTTDQEGLRRFQRGFDRYALVSVDRSPITTILA